MRPKIFGLSSARRQKRRFRLFGLVLDVRGRDSSFRDARSAVYSFEHDACRSESLRAHEYGSKSELLVAQTAPASTIASTHEEKAVVTKGLLPQSLSRRPSQVSCRSSALGMSSVKSVSEVEAAKRSGRDWWMQVVAREKYARAAMLAES